MLTYETAHRLFRYDKDSGVLYWKANITRWNNIGDVAGYPLKTKHNIYLKLFYKRRYYRVHRVVWLMIYGNWPKHSIDHIDGDGRNNRIENMRDVTIQENNRNTKKRSDNTSGVTGVCFVKKTGNWRARITINGKKKQLGCFAKKEDAAAEYRRAADELGFTERHGVSE